MNNMLAGGKCYEWGARGTEQKEEEGCCFIEGIILFYFIFLSYLHC